MALWESGRIPRGEEKKDAQDELTIWTTTVLMDMCCHCCYPIWYPLATMAPLATMDIGYYDGGALLRVRDRHEGGGLEGENWEQGACLGH